MIRLLLIIIAIAGLWWLIFQLSRMPGPQQKQVLSKFLLYGVAGLLLLLVITGRAHWFWVLIGAALPWLQRAMLLKNAYRTFKRSSSSASHGSNQRSTVTSVFLKMQLDHDTGTLSGEVLQGSFKGHRLNDLNLNQLMQLMTQLANDGDSQNLLIAYLDKRFNHDWRQSSQTGPQDNAKTNSQMTSKEALDILGLDNNADQEMIIKAHKKLMQKVHPDRGGSEYLASKINQAKDLLMP